VKNLVFRQLLLDAHRGEQMNEQIVEPAQAAAGHVPQSCLVRADCERFYEVLPVFSVKDSG
jgi:hypothetical protein